MLDELLRRSLQGAPEAELRQAIEEHERAVLASARGGDKSLVGRAEAALRAGPSALSFDAKARGTLTLEERQWSAGRFETATLGALRQRALERQSASDLGAHVARLWVLGGTSPATDIGALQAFSPPDTLFQVASQFNCLESPGPHLTPVSAYLTDPTQGPRASVSAFPGTLLRHYAAPDGKGGRYVQLDDGPQIKLLRDVCPATVSDTQNGYLMDDTILDPPAFLAALRDNFDAIAVGVHDDLDVVLGYDWDGAVPPGAPRIAQVFTSTLAGGGYGGEDLDELFEPLCRYLQRAAYLGTLLAAAALGKTTVVLTLIGGGVFANPIHVIWDAIQWALREVEPYLSRDLDVVVNGRDLHNRLPRETLLGAVRGRGGAVIVMERGSVWLGR